MTSAFLGVLFLLLAAGLVFLGQDNWRLGHKKIAVYQFVIAVFDAAWGIAHLLGLVTY